MSWCRGIGLLPMYDGGGYPWVGPVCQIRDTMLMQASSARHRARLQEMKVPSSSLVKRGCSPYDD